LFPIEVTLVFEEPAETVTGSPEEAVGAVITKAVSELEWFSIYGIPLSVCVWVGVDMEFELFWDTVSVTNSAPNGI
jgi:hypothetical protein